MNDAAQMILEDIRDETRIANRLQILALVRSGIQQKDIAATIGVSQSFISEMFPKGLLRRIAHLSRSDLDGATSGEIGDEKRPKKTK